MLALLRDGPQTRLLYLHVQFETLFSAFLIPKICLDRPTSRNIENNCRYSIKAPQKKKKKKFASIVRDYATLCLTGRRALLYVQGRHGTRTKNPGTPGQA